MVVGNISLVFRSHRANSHIYVLYNLCDVLAATFAQDMFSSIPAILPYLLPLITPRCQILDCVGFGVVGWIGGFVAGFCLAALFFSEQVRTFAVGFTVLVARSVVTVDEPEPKRRAAPRVRRPLFLPQG